MAKYIEQVPQVSGWETSDGETFTDRVLALNHQRQINRAAVRAYLLAEFEAQEDEYMIEEVDFITSLVMCGISEKWEVKDDGGTDTDTELPEEPESI